LKEVIIGTEEPNKYINELSKVPGAKVGGNIFTFSEGPSLKLIKSDVTFVGLLIKVRSVDNTKKHLSTLGFVTHEIDKGLILDDEIFGTQIKFID